MSYQNRLVRTKIIPRFSVIFKFFRNFVFLDVFASLCVLCVYIFHVISRTFLGASGTRGSRPAQMRSSGWYDEVDNCLVGALMDWLW